jgi:hypothetical protein
MSTIESAMFGMGYCFDPLRIDKRQSCAHCEQTLNAETNRGKGHWCALGGFYVNRKAVCDRFKPRSTQANLPVHGDGA